MNLNRRRYRRAPRRKLACGIGVTLASGDAQSYQTYLFPGSGVWIVAVARAAADADLHALNLAGNDLSSPPASKPASPHSIP